MKKIVIVSNPTNLVVSSTNIIRGCCWDGDEECGTANYRHTGYPDYPYSDIGFRIIKGNKT